MQTQLQRGLIEIFLEYRTKPSFIMKDDGNLLSGVIGLLYNDVFL